MLVEQQITGLGTLTFAAPSLISEPSLLPKNALQCFSGQVHGLQNSVKEAGWVDMEGEFRILLSYGKSERMPAHSSVGPASCMTGPMKLRFNLTVKRPFCDHHYS